jgi:hypothetical protein
MTGIPIGAPGSVARLLSEGPRRTFSEAFTLWEYTQCGPVLRAIQSTFAGADAYRHECHDPAACVVVDVRPYGHEVTHQFASMQARGLV